MPMPNDLETCCVCSDPIPDADVELCTACQNPVCPICITDSSGLCANCEEEAASEPDCDRDDGD